MEEPYDGSTLGHSEHPFQQYRSAKNGSDIDLAHNSSTLDSGYLTTSIDSTHVLSLASTPQRLSSGHYSSLNTVPEFSETNIITQDPIKLTPVTENIRNICNFHITTPKDEPCMPGAKRNVAAILNFQDFESTPKKPRTEDAYQIKDVQFESATKMKLRSKKRQPFRTKLSSAPDLDTYFNVNNIENERSPEQETFSPIYDKNTRRGSRTPLSSSGSNLLRVSTPKSSNKKFSYGSGGIYETKPPTSVKKLLKFSESQFEQLLRADQKEDLLSSSTIKTTPTDDAMSRKLPAATTTSSTKKCLAESFVRAGESKSGNAASHDHDLDDSIRPLSSTLNTSPSEIRRFKKMFAVTSTVLRDRDLSRRHLSRPGPPCQRQLSSVDRASRNGGERSRVRTIDDSFMTESQTLSKIEKTETESQGFQNENDMEISTSCMLSPEKTEPLLAITANYDIKSNNDLRLNDSIICEPKSPSPPPQVLFSEPTASSCIPLPRTPKKQKSASLDHERLEILYPMIARTPSKYSSQRRRAACKRKSLPNLSETLKRRKYYGGNTHLNIIAKLGSYSVLLDQILQYLSTHDLANMCEVSNSWRQAVQSNRGAWQKVKTYWDNCKSLKENEFYCKPLECEILKESRPVQTTMNNETVKIPLKQNNNRTDRKRTSEQNRSPPVSPSKRKFHENQKVVRTLAPNEKLIKCPRCSKPSRIFNASLNKDHHNNNLNKTIETSTNKSCHSRSLSETFHTPDYNITTSRNIQSLSSFSIASSTPSSSSSSLPSATMSSVNRRNRFFEKSWSLDSALVGGLSSQSSLAEDDTSQYGECSGKMCKYRFCLDCLCDYHPGRKCLSYKPSSPLCDDGSNEFIQTPSTRVSMKTQRRKTLKRLCF